MANCAGMELEDWAPALLDRNGAPVSYAGYNFQRSVLKGASLNGHDFRDAKFTDADLQDADFGGANLSGADLRGANLSNADLTGANLTNADLRGANLEKSSIVGATLTGSKWSREPRMKGAIIESDWTAAHQHFRPRVFRGVTQLPGNIIIP